MSEGAHWGGAQSASRNEDSAGTARVETSAHGLPAGLPGSKFTAPCLSLPIRTGEPTEGTAVKTEEPSSTCEGLRPGPGSPRGSGPTRHPSAGRTGWGGYAPPPDPECPQHLWRAWGAQTAGPPKGLTWEPPFHTGPRCPRGPGTLPGGSPTSRKQRVGLGHLLVQARGRSVWQRRLLRGVPISTIDQPLPG